MRDHNQIYFPISQNVRECWAKCRIPWAYWFRARLGSACKCTIIMQETHGTLQIFKMPRIMHSSVKKHLTITRRLKWRYCRTLNFKMVKELNVLQKHRDLSHSIHIKKEEETNIKNYHQKLPRKTFRDERWFKYNGSYDIFRNHD